MTITREEFFNFIKHPQETFENLSSDTEKYLKQFAKYHHKNFFFSWNWAAFLGGAFWLFYRRLYTYGIIFYVVSFFLILGGESLTTRILRFSLVLILALSANALYFFHIKTHIKDEKSKGVSPKAVWIAGFIELLLLSIDILKNGYSGFLNNLIN